MATETKGSTLTRVLFGLAFVIAAGSIGAAIMRDRPSSVSAPAATPPSGTNIIGSLEQKSQQNPKDSGVWQQLGWSYFEVGRYADAANAYRKATAITPNRAVFWSSLGEALVMASERDPMPAEAAKAFETAIKYDPKDPRARYFMAVRKDLTGNHQGAIDDWLLLLKDTPAQAPWENDLKRTIEQVGKINKINVAAQLASADKARSTIAMPTIKSVATAAIPGPNRAQMQEAARLPSGQQQAMVQSMVESLEGKLKTNPTNVDGWIMLMRSRMTLNESVKASAALKAAIAANPAQAARLQAEAQSLAVPGA
jgi:cytochrome c-type biogenesis protein CcmH